MFIVYRSPSRWDDRKEFLSAFSKKAAAEKEVKLLQKEDPRWYYFVQRG
jgi:hypothetical protein